MNCPVDYNENHKQKGNDNTIQMLITQNKSAILSQEWV